MDGRLPDILRLSKKHCPRAFLSLITNGDLLDEAMYRELRASGLDALGVSVYDDDMLDKLSSIENDGRLVTLDMRSPRPGQLENRAGSIPGDQDVFGHEEVMLRSCGRPFTMLTINPKGQVVLCCSDMYSEVIMGDVREQRLEDIWTNERFEHYRARLSTEGRRELPLCRSCSYYGWSASVSYPLRTRSF
jgi:radical SAM protein with 4Fe4S-binding SPASM domain